MEPKKVGVLIGSLRKEAWTRKVANKLIALAPSSLQLEIIEIGSMPFYNEDIETSGAPETWVNFRKQIQPLAGVLFVTPEYNRSVPAALKNAIDVGSRPYGKSMWQGKRCGIVSSSIGAIGGFAANNNLRQSLVCLNAPCMPGEILLSSVQTMFDEKGIEMNTKTAEFLQKFMQDYANWVAM